MHPLVEQIEELFLPDLERLVSQMRERFPSLSFSIWRSPAGTLTEYQGHDVGVECLFPEAAQGNPNSVALSLSLCHLSSAPRLMADVVWGHPSGQSEAAFRDNWLNSADWPKATPEIIEELQGTFPKLVRAFKSAVERGVPRSLD